MADQIQKVEEAYQAFLKMVHLSDRIDIRAGFMSGCSMMFFMCYDVFYDDNLTPEETYDHIMALNKEMAQQHRVIVNMSGNSDIEN